MTLGSRWSVAVLILVSLQTSSELIFGRLAGRRLTVCWRRKTLTLRTVRFKASGRSRRKHQQTSGANQAASLCHFPFFYRFPVFPLTSSTVVTSVVFQVTSSLWVAVFKQRAGKKVKAGLLWFFFLSFCFIVVVKKVDGTNHHTARVQTRSEGTNNKNFSVCGGRTSARVINFFIGPTCRFWPVTDPWRNSTVVMKSESPKLSWLCDVESK